MLFNEKRYDFEINGTKCFFSTGKIARKSQSAVLAGMGDTVILATVNSGDPLPDSDYFPMSVEYVEKMAAAGMISSSRFVKRERFPSDDAILKARIIDRSIRPRFPSDYRNEVLIIVEVLSYDPENDPMLLAVNAVSAALLISKTPFTEPVSVVRVGMENGVYSQVLKHIDRDTDDEAMRLNLVVAGDDNGFTNIDANSFEVTEEDIEGAMQYGLEQMKPWIEAQKEFSKQISIEKNEYQSFAVPQELLERMRANYINEIIEVMDISAYDEVDPAKIRNQAQEKVKELLEKINSEMEGKFSKVLIRDAYSKICKEELRRIVKEEQRRLDGRKFDQIREINTEVGILPRAHGTGLFTRGMTQILTICTLGTIRRQQLVEDMTGEDNRSYMHFYSQYPFTIGEAGRYKYQPGRREIGHGALAEKAMAPVLPTKDEFPYTIVLTSEIMSENGSSSMGCTCASSLALMDAGVPIKKPVAGIALGLVLNEEDPNEYYILTDIRDLEDFYGFMDFKVAGTKDGITAIQMDTKAKRLSMQIFKDALQKAKTGRLAILEEMGKTITESKTLSKYAPRVEVVKIAVNKIGDLIGPGGKNIKSINEKTETEIEVEQDGTVYIFGSSDEQMSEALRLVKSSAFTPVVGEIYDGVVASVTDYGAFVDISPSVSGLVHVSEISDEFVKDVSKIVKVGDTFKVKLVSIDDQGRLKLSKKQVK